MSQITRELANFALETRFEDLPESIVQETKLILMDTIGCGLGALTTDKGKMNVALARRFGGPPEASIIGTGDKVSLASAALANGELFVTLDYSNIIAGGHDGVYVIPTLLAIGESTGASGKDLILATAIGLEISARIARAVGRFNFKPKKLPKIKSNEPWPGLTGNAYSNFGAAAAAGRLLKLDEDKMLHALGIAGHLCMVLSYARWQYSTNKFSAKYGVPGWQSTGAVMAVLLAEMGYTGDTTVLDDTEHGFQYYTGYQQWMPEEITDELGKTWCFNVRMHYKPYPCCGVIHSTLDCFYNIIEQNNIRPEEIDSVTTYSMANDNSPAFAHKGVNSMSGAQFNPRYNIAVAAHRVKIGVEWLDPDTMKNPQILKFMDKITCLPYSPKGSNAKKAPPIPPTRVEVVARGKTFVEEIIHKRGTAGSDVSWTDKEVVEKFRHNATRALTQAKIDRAVKSLLELDKIADISEFMREVTL